MSSVSPDLWAAFALLLQNLSQRLLRGVMQSQSKPESMAFQHAEGSGDDPHFSQSGGLHLCMETSHSDALVIFGVTGDLAHKMIFPALYAMVKK
jgi:hypothetical protein